MTPQDQLNRAAERAEPRRFSGTPPSGYAPLDILGMVLRDPNLSPAFRRALAPKRQMLKMSIGYSHPDDESVIDWIRAAMTRDQAAKALRAARSKGLLIEADQTGYCISGETDWNMERGPRYDAPEPWR